MFYVLFGSNAKENGLFFNRYVQKLISDIKILEKKKCTVVVNDKPVLAQFQIKLLLNDIEMLCFLGGELSNTATLT